MTDTSRFAKLEISLRYWLLSRDYHSALKALNLLEMFEGGAFRKDAVTPNIQHMIEIALFVSRLPGIGKKRMELYIVVALLHDLVEDHGVPIEIVSQIFGKRVARAVWNLTKKAPILTGGEQIDISWMTDDGSTLIINKGGTKVGMIERDEDELYAAMAADDIASVIKPSDRFNNQASMSGVFTPAKQVGYVDFTDARIFPMMKIARERFTRLEPAFVILETALRTQGRLVRGWAEELKAA